MSPGPGFVSPVHHSCRRANAHALAQEVALILARSRTIITAAVVAAAACSPLPRSPSHSRTEPKSGGATTLPTLARVPLAFIEAQGQSASEAAYYVHGQDASVWFTAGGLVLSLKDQRGKSHTEFCLGQTATYLGTSAADGITGTSGPDVIVAFGGDDVIDGAGGNDLICAGEGTDSVTGGLGDDTLDGEAGTDRLIETGDVNFTLTNSSLAGVGTDSLAGIEAATLTGGPEETLIDASGFTGPVVIAGGEGEDVLIGGPANDSIDGGGGHIDAVFATGEVNFTLTNSSLTGLGTDALTGVEVVFLSGGPRGQVIDASSFDGSVIVAAGAGPDRVVGGSGRDFLFGEGGKDRIAGSGGRDLVIGGPQADLLRGGPAADRLGGRRGNDRLLGGSGKDRLDGGRGTDTCIGGPGKDTIRACEFPM